MQWMDAVLTFYDSMQWDYTVNNNNVDINDLREELMASIAASYDQEDDILAMLKRPRAAPRVSGNVLTNDGLASPSKLDALLGESPMKKRMRTPSRGDSFTAGSSSKRPNIEDQSPLIAAKKDVQIESADAVAFVAMTPAVGAQTDRQRGSLFRAGPAVVTPSG
jgi:hypothetical protein